MRQAYGGSSELSGPRASSASSSLNYPAVPGRSSRVFSRDPEALQSLKSLLRRRLRSGIPRRPLRVWIPRCASGEDVYSVAIFLFEAFGSRWREIPLHVFATDSDGDALALARAGRYPADAARAFAKNEVARFFQQEDARIRVRPFVREVCRFIKHDDLVQAPPVTQVDMIVCRESLEAVPSSAREGVLRSYLSVLSPGGVLLDLSGAASAAPELFAAIARGGAYGVRDAAVEGRTAAQKPSVKDGGSRFRALFSSSEDAILIYDVQSDCILQANPAAERLFGWSASELAAMRLSDLNDMNSVVKGRGPRGASERRSKERAHMPHRRRKDGTVFPADISASFLMLHGRPCEMLTVRDAGPRLRVHSGDRRVAEQEAFVNDIVHELRSPISVIRGFVETLREGVRGADDRKEFLSFIDSHARRMSGLVDRLLDLGAMDSGKRATRPERVPLAEAVWEIAGAFAPLAKRRRIVIKIDLPGDLAVVVDRADLAHILGNLLDNAVKFTPRGGRISVSGRAARGQAVLSVRDTGPGVAPGDVERIFERFYRAPGARRKKGTGLGLAIVRGIAEANGGRVHAENDPAGGTVFHVALPLPPKGRR